MTDCDKKDFVNQKNSEYVLLEDMEYEKLKIYNITFILH